MSPELLQHGRLTKLNDVYSFAMLLIELWSSKRLFQGLSQQQARPPPPASPCVRPSMLPLRKVRACEAWPCIKGVPACTRMRPC